MAAHGATMRTTRALRRRFPAATLVLGGVYPSFAAQEILAEHPAIDIVVRGEGEETATALADCLASGGALHRVRGISFREGAKVITTTSPPPIVDLDRFRAGWELVDLDRYQLFGSWRAAGMQFSRGCPQRCSVASGRSGVATGTAQRSNSSPSSSTSCANGVSASFGLPTRTSPPTRRPPSASSSSSWLAASTST